MKRLSIILPMLAFTLAADAQPAAPPDTEIAVRISRAFVRQLAQVPFEDDFPVNTEVLGAQVTGDAHLEGKVDVRLHRHDQESAFDLIVRGEVRTQTVATRRPVEVFSHGLTEFDARQRVKYDGETFTKEAAIVDARHHSDIDGIGTPPGLRGVVIRVIARPQIRRNQPRANQVALQETRSKITEKLEPEAEKLVEALNDVLPVVRQAKAIAKGIIAKELPDLKDWKIYRATSDTHLIGSVGLAGRRIAPRVLQADEGTAPVEIWVRGKIKDALKDKGSALVALFGPKLRERVAKTFPDSAKLLNSFSTATVDGWLVVHLGDGLLRLGKD